MSKQSELDDFMKVLDSFATTVSINKFKNNESVDLILESSEEERLSWTDEVLENKAFILYSYGAYLQRCLNQQQVKLKWAQSNLRVIYGRESSKYERWSYQERQDSIVAENSAALVLHQIIMNAETRIAQLDHIAQYVSHMAGCLKDISKAKRSQRYENRS